METCRGNRTETDANKHARHILNIALNWKHWASTTAMPVSLSTTVNKNARHILNVALNWKHWASTSDVPVLLSTMCVSVCVCLCVCVSLSTTPSSHDHKRTCDDVCRYTAIYVGLPSVEEDMVTKDITPQQCRCGWVATPKMVQIALQGMTYWLSVKNKSKLQFGLRAREVCSGDLAREAMQVQHLII